MKNLQESKTNNKNRINFYFLMFKLIQMIKNEIVVFKLEHEKRENNRSLT